MYKNFIVEDEIRLDKYLSLKINASRNQIEQLIKKEFVKVDQKTTNKPSYKLKLNQNIEVFFPSQEVSVLEDETFLKESLQNKKVEIIYEDDDILVINKPFNLTVHKAPSVKEATLVDWLKLQKISLSTISGEERHGIVHRLDKGTSGIMVIAKTNEAHKAIAKELESRDVGRYYLAIIDLPLKESLIVEKPIGRNPNNRLKMGIVENARYAKSMFSKIEISKNHKYELIACSLFTGRTHQIRAHLSSISRHIVGDTLYGFKGELNKIKRFFLHAYCLEFTHPTTKQRVSFFANIENTMQIFINNNFDKEKIDEKINSSSFIHCFDNIY